MIMTIMMMVMRVMMVMIMMMMAMIMRMVMTMMHVLIHLSAESSCNPPNPMLGEEFYVLKRKAVFIKRNEVWDGTS